MVKAKAKHYSPAYHRYHKEHPTISIILSKETKAALDAARGELDLSYAEFIKSLFSQDGVFSQFKKERDTLKSERTAFESEKKNLALEYDKKKRALEIERTNLTQEFAKKKQVLEEERTNLNLEHEQKNQAFDDERNNLIHEYDKKIRNYEYGIDALLKTERFFVPCAKCYQPILFDSTQPNWNMEIKPTLLQTFSGSKHYVCPR